MVWFGFNYKVATCLLRGTSSKAEEDTGGQGITKKLKKTFLLAFYYKYILDRV